MNDVPHGWTRSTIEQLAGASGLVTDGDWIESKDQDPNGEVRLVQLADIGDGEFRDRSDRFVTPETVRRLNCTLLHEGDLLIARMPDPLGRACVFPGVGQPAITAVDVLVWRASRDGPNPRWLMHFVNSPDVRQTMLEQAGGTTRQRVAGGRIKRLEIPVPPLAEQARIAAKIDSLSAKSKRVRDQLDRIPRLVEKYKQAILSEAFRGNLTNDWRLKHLNLAGVMARSEEGDGYAPTSFEANIPYKLPPSWRWLRLPQLGTLDRGRSRHRPRNDPRLFGGKYPFIQTGDVRAAHRFLKSYNQTYSDFGLSQSRLWPIGTLCITIAANIANTAILTFDACFPDSVVGFSADPDRTTASYVEFFLRTAQADLEAFAPATAQKNINLETLGEVLGSVPE
jgi:type I restriction enzyme S subunit